MLYTMSKNFELKQQVVEEIKQKIEAAHSVVLYDYCGLTVAEVTELRTQCRNAGIDYVVYKNTLVNLAMKDLGVEGMESLLKGPTAFAFGMQDAVAPAKVLTEFVKKVKKTAIKGGLLDRQALDIAGVQALADLPPKEVLIAKMMGSLNAPITNFVGVLSATLRSLVYAINAVRKQKAGEE
ncbi:MAG: 50S ribosomal protein L10 [Christensenellales bacterium]